MKRSLVTIAALIIALAAISAPAAFALSEPQYYYVAEDTVMVIDGSENEITIPATWYVEYVSDIADSSDFKKVRYNGVTGRVVKSALSNKTTSEPLGSPYFSYGGVISKKSSMSLFLFTDLKNQISAPVANFSKIEFIAFPADTENKCIYARVVIADNVSQYGFIYNEQLSFEPAIQISNSQESKNPDLATGEDVLKPPVTDTKSETPTNDVLKIILITAVCILSVVVVFLIFKPTKTKKSRDYYDRES